MTRLLLGTGAAIMTVGAPLLVLELLQRRVRWIRERHDGLSIIVWFAAVTIVGGWLLPHLGLEYNGRLMEALQ